MTKVTELLFLDCETTGLDPTYYSMISISAISVDADLNPDRIYSKKCWPRAGSGIDPEALAVNGYDPATWEADHTSPSVMIADMLMSLAPAPSRWVIVGRNPYFDLHFLRTEAAYLWYEGAPRVEEQISHRSIDLHAVRMWAEVTRGRKLEYEPEARPHTAEQGALYNLHLFEQLMQDDA